MFVNIKTKDPYVLAQQRTQKEGGVLPDDEPLDPVQQVTWFLRSLTAREYEERKDLISGTESDGEIRAKMGSWTWYTLRRGLVGVEGPTPEGFKFETEDLGGETLVKDTTLSQIGPTEREELAARISVLSRPEPHAKKD